MKEILSEADFILCAFSGGKDSLACLELLIQQGYRDKIELHHHLVDGAEDHFFDWAITQSYCKAVAEHYGVPIYFSYREGGFRREMLRDNTSTAKVIFELPDGGIGESGGTGKPNTRLKFPMPTADLKIRWCSSTLKISCMDASIRNQERFTDKKTAVITGERREESPGRSKYKAIEPHRSNCKKREVWHCRPVLDLTTKEIWQILQGSGVVPHPCYFLGYGRASCRCCIFINNDDLATLQQISPEIVTELTDYESQFDKTISYDKSRDRQGLKQLTTAEKAALGVTAPLDPYWVNVINSTTWDIPVHLPEDQWQLPIGANGDIKSGSW